MIRSCKYSGAIPELYASHFLQVQVKSQVICCKSKSSHKFFGQRASQVKSQVISTPVKSSHKSSQVKSSQAKSQFTLSLPHNGWLACIWSWNTQILMLVVTGHIHVWITWILLVFSNQSLVVWTNFAMLQVITDLKVRICKLY